MEIKCHLGPTEKTIWKPCKHNFSSSVIVAWTALYVALDIYVITAELKCGLNFNLLCRYESINTAKPLHFLAISGQQCMYVCIQSFSNISKESLSHSTFWFALISFFCLIYIFFSMSFRMWKSRNGWSMFESGIAGELWLLYTVTVISHHHPSPTLALPQHWGNVYAWGS